MQTKVITTTKPNGTKVKSKSFKSILEEMMQVTSKGDIKVANRHWDIFYRVTNNIDYNLPSGA